MEAVWLAFRAESRRRWRSWLAVAALVAVVAGVVLATASAGRRTESAFPGFVAAHGFDAIVFANQQVPQVSTVPDVTSATILVSLFNGQPTCRCTHPINASDFDVSYVSPSGRSVFKLVSGHFPDPSAPGQVLASFAMQQDFGVHLGTVIHVPLYAASQTSVVDNATGALPKPTGPTFAFTVVGFEASEIEFPYGSTPIYGLVASQAFERTVIPRLAAKYLYFVRLRHGAADIIRFQNAASNLNLGSGSSTGYLSEDALAASIEKSIHPQATGWWILAVLSALVGLAIVGQALARQSIVESEDYPTMQALGVNRRQLVLLSTARNVLVGLVGAAGAVVLAFALSPIAPLGEARAAETSSGVTFDAFVLPVGALITLVVVVGLGLWPAVRASRGRVTDNREPDGPQASVVARLAATITTPSAVIGVRHALERGRGARSVPVGTALFGTVLAVLALCATAVFGASLSHLTTTPKLYGDPFQLSINPNGGPSNPALLASLEHDKAVTGITEWPGGATISLNNVQVGIVAASSTRGRLLFSTAAGHLPNSVDEVGLGSATMRRIGAQVGSVVQLSGASGGTLRTQPMRVVAQVSFPVIAGGVVSLGTGALITTAGLYNAVCPPGPTEVRCRTMLEQQSNGGILVRFVSGPRGRAALNHYLNTYSSIATVPSTPTSLINFGEAVNFPLIFGAILALFGAATLTHLLVVSVSRRRREIGLLKVLGFVNRQVVAAVIWQASTVALVGIVIGVPLGIVVGRAIWEAFSANLGAVPVAVVPFLVLGGLVATVLVVANLLAVGPALVARRSKAADLLRAP